MGPGANDLTSGRMHAVAPQYTANQVLRIFHRDEAYLFLGAAFTTVGIVSAAFSLLRRKLDPLLLWFALFAVIYGQRLWIYPELGRLLTPDTSLYREIRVALNFAVPIPAFWFLETAGFLGSWGKRVVYALTALFLGLIAATFLFGPHDIFQRVNDVTVIVTIVVMMVRSILRRNVTRDYLVIRRGLLVFAASVVCGNISGEMGHYWRIEPYGFAVFLGCLGYVAARQTLERESKLGELQKELEVARRIQLSILPVAFPASVNFNVAATYLPMTSVAGDFYEFLLGNDRQAGLLIADVSGHGVPAALIASMVKMAATSQRAQVANPAELLSGMNAALVGNTQQQFVTAAYVYLDSQAGELRYSAAGHPPMLLLRRGGEVIEIEENGLMLAAFSFSTYSNAFHRLEPGDRLLLYTDGITEASDRQRVEFGGERLRALLQASAALSPSETADLIVSKVGEWAESQEDDLTVLVCDYVGNEKAVATGQRGLAREEVAVS